MKKLFVVILAGLAMVLTACGGEDRPAEPKADDNQMMEQKADENGEPAEHMDNKKHEDVKSSDEMSHQDDAKSAAEKLKSSAEDMKQSAQDMAKDMKESAKNLKNSVQDTTE